MTDAPSPARTGSAQTRSTVLQAQDMLSEAWTLSPSVALRPEPFGALAYHFGNRRLTFLKRPELVAVVRALGGSPDVRAALVAAGVPDAEFTSYLAALRGLAAADMIRPGRQS